MPVIHFCFAHICFNSNVSFLSFFVCGVLSNLLMTVMWSLFVEHGYSLHAALVITPNNRLIMFVLVSKAYHLGQEETDWFEKPREARSDRSKHHGSGSHSSTGRRSKHTYHDYDEPPEEYCPGDEYSQQRHTSSLGQREHRHHGSTSGRHSSSRHASEDPRSSRSSRTHPKDPTARGNGRGASSLQRRSGTDSRSAQASPRNSSDFSRELDPSRHHGTGGRGHRPQGDRTTRRQDPTANGSKQQQAPQSHSGQQRSGGQGNSGRHPGSESLDAPQQAQQQHQQTAHQQQRSQTPPQSQPTPTTTAAGPVLQQTKSGPDPSGQPAVRQPPTTNVSGPETDFNQLFKKKKKITI